MNRGFRLPSVRTTVCVVGSVIAAFILGALPHVLFAYFIWNAPFGRIPYVGQVIFDTHIYMQWIGALVERWPNAAQFGWFNPLLQALGSIPGISVSETWVMSRSVSLLCLMWASWWSARLFLSKRASAAFVIVGVAFPMLALSLRPGAYAWYLPCAIAGFASAWCVQHALRDQKWLLAVAWTVAGLVLGSVYPWYALTIGLLLVGVWAPQIIRWLNIRVITAMWIAISALFGGLAVWLASRFVDPSFLPMWQYYERTAIAWSRLPVITNVLAAAVLIAVVVGIAAVALRRNEAVQDRMFVLVMAWIALFASWFHSVATSLYTSNDHFRSGVLLLAWFTAIILYSIEGPWSGLPTRYIAWMRRVLLGIFVVGIAMAIRCTFATIAGIGNDYLQQFHVALWASLVFIALITWVNITGRSLKIIRPTWWLLAWSIVGALSYGNALVSEARLVQEALPQRELILWIREHVPAQTTACAAPELADKLSAQTGRRIYPSESTSYLRETHAALAERLRVIFSRRVPADEQEIAASRMTYIGYRTASCGQFGFATHVLRVLGVSPEKINQLAGCDAEDVEAEWNAIHATRAEDISDDTFRTICPIVYFPAEDRGSWWLPPDYKETRIGGYILMSRSKVVFK